jgi:ketosteroid isomerase-like protein
MARSTEEVLDHHLQSFGSGNLEGILEDFTPESVILSADDGVLRTRDQMAGFFQAMFDEFAKPGASFSLDKRIIDGDTAFIAWSAETADNVYDLGTDTLVVRDGKIVTQTFVVKKTPK